VGAVAGIIGLATLATGGGDSGTSAAPSTSVSATPGDGFTPTDGPVPPGGVTPTDGVAPGDGQQPGADGGVPVPSFSPSPTGGIAAPGDGAAAGDGTGTGTGGGTGAGTGGGGGYGGAAAAGSGSGYGGAEDVRMPLRVYNNSTIPGLAARGASDFEAAGWTVTDIGGYNGQIPVSTVYYRTGTAEKDSADFLAQAFGLRAEPRFEGIRDSSPGLIVILTRDYQGA
jgi:hypothetical protein